MDLKSSNDKISMQQSSVPYERSLPDQILGNSRCISEIEINIKSGNGVVDMLIEYDEGVNLEDITNLRGDLKFSDQFEIAPIEKRGLKKSKYSRINLSKNKKRTINLLEKFGDSDCILDSETWHISVDTEHNNRNKEL